jgi:hypothetical protein
MSIQKHNKKMPVFSKLVIDEKCNLAEKMAVNVEEHLNEARSELANCQLRVQQLRALVQQGERWQGRFNALISGATAPLHRKGITEAIKAVIEAAPGESFTTTKIRVVLQSQDFDTGDRNFHSSLSTALTRLGRAGFISITKDDAGIRVYQKKGTPE